MWSCLAYWNDILLIDSIDCSNSFGYELAHTIGRKTVSEFVQWLKTEWGDLERRTGRKYSARRLSVEAGLSPNTLYQLLKHPEVTPRPETCHKLAVFFNVSPLWLLQLAGHLSATESGGTSSELDAALQRGELKNLMLSARDLSLAEVQLVQQMVDQLRLKRREADVASGAAVALVVDDTPDARATLVTMLRVAGLKVLEAADGQSALELMETSGALVDVVIMDYKMPRMNGVEATRQIRKRFPDLHVLFVSAWDEPEMKKAAFEAGAVEYLVAPVGYDQLVEAVSQARRHR
jgi:CheY-like chemotaxis protein/transcriptional regulator with XRE-family HTH domain